MSEPSIFTLLVETYWDLRARVDDLTRTRPLLDEDDKMRIAAGMAYDVVLAELPDDESRAVLEGDGREVVIAILLQHVRAS